MNCVLIQPPLCDPTCPPLGLGYLSAALEQINLQHFVFDLNLDFIEFIESFYANIKIDLGERSIESQPSPCKFPASSSEYLSRAERLRNSFQVISQFFPQTPLEPFRSIQDFDGDLTKIVQIAHDPYGLYMTWLKASCEIDIILDKDPSWIGLSVSYVDQLPGALAIARYCKKHSRATVICGGALFKDFELYLNAETPIWDFIDGIIVGPGENIIKCLVINKNGLIIPQIGRQDLSNGKWIARTEQKIDPLLPNFQHFPLQRYRAVGLVLPYRVFSRCTWDKCVFCADSKYSAHLPSAGGDPVAIADELSTLITAYSADGIYFLDAELPVQFMIELSLALEARFQSPPRWGANSRFSHIMLDPAVSEGLFRGGCRFLRFGLESASPEILSMMQKGIDPSIAEQILATSHQAGIATHLYLMKHFPGETVEDWETTKRFVFRNSNHIDMISVSYFRMYHDSPLCRRSDNIMSNISSSEHWSHKTSQELSYEEINDDFESTFLSSKTSTRCFLTPADTIILSDRMSLSYFSTNQEY